MKEQRGLTPFQVNELNKKIATEDEMKRLAEGEFANANDGTQVSNTTWGLLKEEAMKDNYNNEQWYTNLSAEDKKLVYVLRTAQKLQGNMEPLNQVSLTGA